MGRYEFLLKKTPKEEMSFGNKGIIVSKTESPTEFLEKVFQGKPLTKIEINDSLVDYYGRYSKRKGLKFEILVDEEGEGLEISPSNDYTLGVMQKVRNIFKKA
jgi:hypothetical protein